MICAAAVLQEGGGRGRWAGILTVPVMGMFETSWFIQSIVWQSLSAKVSQMLPDELTSTLLEENWHRLQPNHCRKEVNPYTHNYSYHDILLVVRPIHRFHSDVIWHFVKISQLICNIVKWCLMSEGRILCMCHSQWQLLIWKLTKEENGLELSRWEIQFHFLLPLQTAWTDHTTVVKYYKYD